LRGKKDEALPILTLPELGRVSFDFNDELIPVGATFWVRLVEKFLAR